MAPLSASLQRARPSAPRRLAFVLVVTVSLSGCVVALGGQSHVSGAHLPASLVPIEATVSEVSLLALYGAPTHRDTKPASVVELQWTEVLRPRACRTYLFSAIPLSRD